ncbi:hypothetical protein STEG23_004732 [Scotinomys teguina]
MKRSDPGDRPPSLQLWRFADSTTARGTQGSMYLCKEKTAKSKANYVNQEDVTHLLEVIKFTYVYSNGYHLCAIAVIKQYDQIQLGQNGVIWLSGASDNNTDPDKSRAMDPDMDLSHSSALDVTMALSSSTG